MMLINSLTQPSSRLPAERQTTYDRLQQKMNDLNRLVNDNTVGSAGVKICKDLGALNRQMVNDELSEQTAKLDAEQRLLDEETSRKKRQRDRELYHKHEEDYLFNASIEKLVLAKDGQSAGIRQSITGSANNIDTADASDDTPAYDDPVGEARAIGIEEAQAARRHKQEIKREVEKEEATHKHRPADLPEPIIRTDLQFRRFRKRKVDIRV